MYSPSFDHSFFTYIYIYPDDFCDRHALQLGRSMVLTECLCTPMHKIALLGRCKRCRRSCHARSPICNFIANCILVVCLVGKDASATMPTACHAITLMFAHAYMDCCSADLHTTCCIAVSPYGIQHAGPRNFFIIHPIGFGYEFGER